MSPMQRMYDRCPSTLKKPKSKQSIFRKSHKNHIQSNIREQFFLNYL